MGELTRVIDLLEIIEDAESRGETVDTAQLCRQHGCEELHPQLERVNRDRLRMNDTLAVAVDETVAGPAAGFPELGKSLTEVTTYTISSLISNAGGLGVVFRARDSTLHRDVALKVLRTSGLHSEEELTTLRERFELEAEITSRLDHPGVPPVFGIGTMDSGKPYYAMRYIEGKTLDEAIAEHYGDTPMEDRNLQFRRLLQEFVSVCRVIAYAHGRGVIHRDIKPSNVLLGRFGETVVIDWGLATTVARTGPIKVSHEKTLLPERSATDSRAATPAYMSPEQAGGMEIGPASDIYNLGATLFKILTGEPPVRGDNTTDIQRKIVFGEVAEAGAVNTAVSPALNALCRKAMATAPAARYATALELAEEVERYLADSRVEAYDEPLTRRVARWTRRHRSITQLGAAAVLLLLTAVIAFSLLQTRTAHRAESAKEQGLLLQASLAAYELEKHVSGVASVLRQLTNDAAFAEAVAVANDSPDDRALWAPVNRVLDLHRARWESPIDTPAAAPAADRGWKEEQNLQSYAWTVNLESSGRGVQAARSPRIDPNTGAPFASLGVELGQTREYFHGTPPDVVLSRYAMLRGQHLCAPFSGSNGSPAVVLSRSISWRGDDVGVAGIALELHAITQLTDVFEDVGSEEFLLTIVHAGADRFDGQTLGRGLILQHEHFANDHGGAGPTPQRVYRVPEPLLARLSECARSPRQVLHDYTDPLGEASEKYGGRWTAAVAPLPQTPWLIVIQSR